MKSTTWPRPKAGSRNSRSPKWEVAPPRSSPSAYDHGVERTRHAYQAMATTAIPAKTVKIQVTPVPMEKAAPGL